MFPFRYRLHQELLILGAPKIDFENPCIGMVHFWTPPRGKIKPKTDRPIREPLTIRHANANILLARVLSAGWATWLEWLNYKIGQYGPVCQWVDRCLCEDFYRWFWKRPPDLWTSLVFPEKSDFPRLSQRNLDFPENLCMIEKHRRHFWLEIHKNYYFEWLANFSTLGSSGQTLPSVHIITMQNSSHDLHPTGWGKKFSDWVS